MWSEPEIVFPDTSTPAWLPEIADEPRVVSMFGTHIWAGSPTTTNPVLPVTPKLPPIVLARGIRQKDRFVIAVGAIVAILTFVSNKPYLGWPRHTWDPMLLGILLTGVALFIRRWLDRGPGRIRYGFTAARLSAKDKEWMNTGSVVLGLVTPQSITAGQQKRSADFEFGGGTSGGGGASGEF